MKIAFFCGSLDIGRDGVGDYTRRLAAEMILRKHQAQIIALDDRDAKEVLIENQTDINVEIETLRIPKTVSQKKRLTLAKEAVNSFAPDWCSLQFVPFSYHDRGLPFDLGKILKNISSNVFWHVMFHEIWQGGSLKSDLIGRIQKRIIKSLLNSIKPRCVSTSNVYYQNNLFAIGVNSEKIPIFNSLSQGNYLENAAKVCLPEEILADRKKFIIASFFGGMVYNQELLENLKILAEKTKNAGKKLFVSHIGYCPAAKSFFPEIMCEIGVPTVVFGERQEQEIANYLFQADLGLSTHPKILYEKSSSIATMLNNKLPVLLLNRSFEKDNREISEIKEILEISQLNDFLFQNKDFSNVYGSAAAAEKFIRMFESNTD